jgi:enoyl-CoA hydratase/carnithine racemase
MAAIRAAMAGCFDSSDYREGRRAFMEKRKPAFTGA